jgi:hypothetical protein
MALTIANRNLFERIAAIEAAVLGDGSIGVDKAHDVYIMTNAGTPVDGTSGTGVALAGPGSLCIDFTNAVLYINTNTKASPLWESFTSST